MKNMQKKTQRLCSDFDDRPIYDIYDNLYAGTEEYGYTRSVNNKKKSKTERNNEKTAENTAQNSEI